MFWVNYERGVRKGESPGQAAAVSLLVLTLIVGASGSFLWWHKHKGGETRSSDLWRGHPGEDGKPPGWLWNDKAKRWMKPPQSGT